LSAPNDPLAHLHRDLGSDELWRRSLARSRLRRAKKEYGASAARSLVSSALADLDGPARQSVHPLRRHRDLADPEVWDFSLACARAKRRAAEPGLLPQARVAGASLLIAAVAAAVPVQGTAASRARAGGATRAHVELLQIGDRGPRVAALQRALGIQADGIFGPRTRAAVRAFQKRHGLLVDGIVGPQTRAALARERNPTRSSGMPKIGSRGPAVAALQRRLGIPADGIFGPQTHRAVRRFQARHGLTVDGIVGPQTRAALNRGGGGSASTARRPSRARAVGGVDRRLWAELGLARRLGLRLVSAHRPGSRLSSGKLSDHGYYPSRAIDVAGSKRSMRRYARAVAGMRGVDIVIYSPVGMWQAGIGWHGIESGQTRRDHYDHVHVDTF
jgi:peptidoglycan hydrolase-like protein with peptidoglycan-binding domain